MKKICTVVGARPQFIKLAVVSRVLRKCFQEVLIHTGQHYDHNMSGVFFEELEIPRPDYNLGISGGTHGQMTGQMLIKIEEVLLREQPDLLLVFGDTNSTIAGALAAVKLGIPVCHVEAGNRLGTYESPEEVNRILTDHVSSLHLVCTASGVEFLKREGFSASIHLVGDPMYDAFRHYSASLNGIELPAKEFYYMTCHRQENTDQDEKLRQILQAMNCLDAPTVYPVHPRNRERTMRLCQEHRYENIILLEPVGYKTSIALVNGAKKIVTDSGGLQREAFFAQKPCVTVFDYVAWPETMVNGCNQVAKPDCQDILSKLQTPVRFDPDYQPFGDGHAAEKIVDAMGIFLEA
jgi:UDP-N-acetylglucosamine 2-epimerase (non-hydrolysing)/UDP-GlcNAc3NAcA epimerase